MANYSNLKTAIENAVDWNNGDNEITGQNLLDILETIIDSLGAKYKFADVATPSSSITTPDEPLFYLAGAGTYTNFSGLSVTIPRGTLAIFYYDTAWHYTTVRTDSDAFFNINQYLEAPSTTYTKANARNAVPAALRSKGMIITYLTTNGWLIEQNLSTSGTWNADANWQTIGPVSVSQNIETGKTQLEIGGTPELTVDFEPEDGSHNLIESGGVKTELDEVNKNIAEIKYNARKTKIDIVFHDGGFWDNDHVEYISGYSYSDEYKISKGSTVKVKSGGDVYAIIIRYAGGSYSRVLQDGTLNVYELTAKEDGAFVLSYKNSVGFEYCEVDERDNLSNEISLLENEIFGIREMPLIDILPEYVSGDTPDIIFCNSDAQITSSKRFRRIDVFAYAEGEVEVCFIQMSGSTPNILGSFFIHVYAGNNSISIDDTVDVPFFDGICYIGISANAGIFGWNSSVETDVYYITKSTGTSLLTHFYASYKIGTYDFDINDVMSKEMDVLLPKGQIDVDSSKIILKPGQRLKGAGIDKTLLKNKLSLSGANSFIETRENNEICDLTIMGGTHYTPRSIDADYSTLDDIKNRTDYPSNNWIALYLIGGGVFVHNVNIYDFERGIEIYSTGTLYAPTKITDSTINWCIEGLWVRNDYIAVSNLFTRHNKLGLRVTGGNDYFTNCHFDENLNGAYFAYAGNDSHGSVCGCSFNHNSIYGLAVDGIINGECFLGCQCWEHSLYVRNAAGFNWSCGECDCSIYLEGGTKGYFTQTAFKHDYWDRQEGIHHNYNGHTDYIVMKDNFFIGETGENDSILNN